MFTGIIEATGIIQSVTPLGDATAGVRVTIDASSLDCSDIAIGDSVAISGACLTVVANEGSRLQFDVSSETLRCTAGLDALRSTVNLEKALRFGDRLGGHLVSGHVDGVGTVKVFSPEGESHRLEVEVPRELARFIAVKGSITIDGVSLTVNEVSGSTFAVNLIPHTLSVTALGGLNISMTVNLEVDLLARYVERLMQAREEGRALDRGPSCDFNASPKKNPSQGRVIAQNRADTTLWIKTPRCPSPFIWPTKTCSSPFDDEHVA